MTGAAREPERAVVRAGRWLRPAGYALGLCLLLGAVAMAWQRREGVLAAVDAAGALSLGPTIRLLAAVAANVVLSGLFLRELVRRYGPVGIVEMQALVAAATLLNFLPLRPGLLGRAAYHRAVNGIPVADTVRTVVQALVISVAVAGALAAAVATSAAAGFSIWLAVGSPLALLGAAMGVPRARPWALAAAIRYAEVLVWAVRYHAAFALIGAPIGLEAALAFACASVIPMSIPFVGNGLGLREWAIGLLAPVLTGHALELGVTADLVNRGAEIVVVVVLGLAGAAWVARRMRYASASIPRSPTVNSDSNR